LHLIWEDFYNWEKRDHFALLKLYQLVKGEELDSASSKYFPQAGIEIMHDKDFYLITGHHKGCYGKGGNHTHNDILSFELSMLGEDLVIDPGNYVYTSDYQERNKFRSTRAHNIALVNDQEQSHLFQDPFFFEQKVNMNVLIQKETDESIVFEAEHDAYKKLDKPIIYQRSFNWDKKCKILVIKDKFLGQADYHLEWNFHLAPNIKTWVKDNHDQYREVILVGSNTFLLSAPKELNCAIIEDEVSPSYGVKASSKTIRFSGFLQKKGKNEFEFKFEAMNHND
jgi:uncharacterized heparinase superfamily protein